MDEKCLRCNDGEPKYCEECFQDLIAMNTKLQVQELMCDSHWCKLKQYLTTFKQEKERDGYSDANERYCIAMSIDDILEIMEMIEKGR